MRHRPLSVLSAWALAACALAAAAMPNAARAGDIRVMCYSDGNECEATTTLSAEFMRANPDVHVTIDQVPYKTVLESLPVQLAAGNGPDVARVTLFGPVLKYLMDLRPYLKDAAYWEESFAPILPWMRADKSDHGIYGLPTQLTITSPIVNKTLFDQANVPLPGPDATWDDWAAAVDKVAKATKTPYGMAFDRSGHRFAGAAISEGAKYFTPDGHVDVVDPGFKAMAGRMVAWSHDGTFDKDVWVAAGGGYRDAFEEFANGKIVFYLSGSWQLQRLQKQIGDAFEWTVVGNPCGAGGCTGMPGGASFVAFKQSKNPADVARWLDWLASKPVYARYMGMTNNIPALAALQAGGVDYKLTPAGNAALKAFGANATRVSKVAYQLQGFPYAGSLFNPTADRLSQAMSGQITLDQAYARIGADVNDALAAVKP